MPPKIALNQTDEKRPAAMPALVLPFTKDELREAGKAAGMRGKIFESYVGSGALLPPLWTIVEEYVGTEESFSWRYIRQTLLGNATLKSGEPLKESLFSFIQEAESAAEIKEEKEREAKAVCAGNAFTLLNIGDVPFSGKIFRRIYARGVNLRGGILHATRFEDCRMVDMDITGAYAQSMQVVRSQVENFRCERSEIKDEKTAPPSSYWRARGGIHQEEKSNAERHFMRTYRESSLMCPMDPADTQLFSTRFVGNKYHAEIVVWDIISGQLIKYENGDHGRERFIADVTPPEHASDAALVTFRKSGDIHAPTLFYFHKGSITKESFVDFDRDVYATYYFPQHALFAGIGREGAQYQAYIWDVKTPQDPMHILKISSNAQRIVFSPDGKYLAVLYFDRIEMWSVAFRRRVHTFRSNSLALGHLYFSPNGQWVAATAHSGTGEDKDEAVFIWKNEPEKYSSVQPQRPFHTFTLNQYFVSIGHFTFSPDGNFWAVSTSEAGNFLYIWETASKKLKTKFQTSGSSCSIVWKQMNNDFLLVTSGDQGIFCWDVLKGSQGEMNLSLRWTTYQRNLVALGSSFLAISVTSPNESALTVLKEAGAQITVASTVATPAVADPVTTTEDISTAVISTTTPSSGVTTQVIDDTKSHQKHSRWRVFFFILGVVAVLALCFSPLGPLVFSALPIAMAAALTSAVTFATTAAGAGWTILAAAVVTGFIVANLDRALIIVAALTLNVLKAVFSLCAFICNSVVVPLANYLMRALTSDSFGFLEKAGWVCLILLWLPAFITGSLMMGMEKLRQSSLYHRAVMEVRNLFGKAESISRWPVEAPLTYSQAVGDIREFNCWHMFQNFKDCAIRYGCDATIDVFKENNPEDSSTTPSP